MICNELKKQDYCAEFTAHSAVFLHTLACSMTTVANAFTHPSLFFSRKPDFSVPYFLLPCGWWMLYPLPEFFLFRYSYDRSKDLGLYFKGSKPALQLSDGNKLQLEPSDAGLFRSTFCFIWMLTQFIWRFNVRPVWATSDVKSITMNFLTSLPSTCRSNLRESLNWVSCFTSSSWSMRTYNTDNEKEKPRM